MEDRKMESKKRNEMNPEYMWDLTPILILDDSTSALDFATDANLRAAIRGLTPRPTLFIVSQRAASVMHADKIAVLDRGEVVGMGTHAELLENCEVYKEIYYSQFRKEKEDAQ
jgi:ABC-type multidrug transport system fused ATPase/permease subunit